MVEEKDCLWPPIGAPLNVQHEDQWKQFDSSVDALSFGFVATAILVSMFLVMAIFERFYRPSTSPPLSPSGGRSHRDLEARVEYIGKLSRSSTKMRAYNHEVSVLMPGNDFPTFIAHPVPLDSPPQHITCPLHRQNSFPSPTP